MICGNAGRIAMRREKMARIYCINNVSLRAVYNEQTEKIVRTKTGAYFLRDIIGKNTNEDELFIQSCSALPIELYRIEKQSDTKWDNLEKSEKDLWEFGLRSILSLFTTDQEGNTSMYLIKREKP